MKAKSACWLAPAHLVTGPCSICGETPQRVHVIEGAAIYCGKCCPECKPLANPEWDTPAPAATLTGEQGGLW